MTVPGSILVTLSETRSAYMYLSLSLSRSWPRTAVGTQAAQSKATPAAFAMPRFLLDLRVSVIFTSPFCTVNNSTYGANEPILMGSKSAQSETGSSALRLFYEPGSHLQCVRYGRHD